MKKKFILFLIFLVSDLIIFSQNVLPFQNADNIVFVGNSITDGGHYHSYIWLYYMTRFPDRRIEISNSGISGDAALQINRRFEDDVISKKPSVIYLSFGMNDTGYEEYLQKNTDSLSKKKDSIAFQNYLLIEKKLQLMTKTQKVILSSTPYDETNKGGFIRYPKKNAAILRVADWQEKSAENNNWGFIDLNRPMTEINLREQQRDSTFTLCGNDRIHPDYKGHLAMAYFILKSQGLCGKVVADVLIDISTNKIVKAENCKIDQFGLSGDTIRFRYLAKSLPFPVDPRSSEALKYIPFTEDLNREMLAIKGLKSGQYVLKIDNVEVGKWSAEDFSKGINLATQVRTPQYQQAINVMSLNERRWEIERYFRTYYGIQYRFFRDKNLMYVDDEKSLDTLKKYASSHPLYSVDFYQYARFEKVRGYWTGEMKELVKIIYDLNKPQKRLMEIRPCATAKALTHAGPL